MGSGVEVEGAKHSCSGFGENAGGEVTCPVEEGEVVIAPG